MAAQVAIRRQIDDRLLVENAEAGESCEVDTQTATGQHGMRSPSKGR